MSSSPRLSLTDVWDETRRYVASEAALLLPVALATIGLATLLLSLAIPATTPGNATAMQPGAPTLWLIPYAVLLVYGTLALSVLALTPGISVREALRLGVRWLGAGLLVFLITVAAGMGVLVVAGVALGVVGTLAGLPLERAAQLGVVLALPAMLLLSVRLLLALPAVVDGSGATGALKRSWRLTRPIVARLTALMLAAAFVSFLILLTTQAAAGSAILLAARLAGVDALGRLLVDVLSAFMASVLQIVIASYAAFLYRRLAGSISGT